MVKEPLSRTKGQKNEKNFGAGCIGNTKATCLHFLSSEKLRDLIGRKLFYWDEFRSYQKLSNLYQKYLRHPFIHKN